MSRHFARFLVLNVVGLALFVAAWMNGLVQMAIDGDKSRITLLIAAAFLIGTWLCGRRLATLRKESKNVMAWHIHCWLDSRIDIVDEISNRLVVLGFIGTIVGFLMAFSGLDVASVSGAEDAAALMGQILPGLSVALYTTLAGLIFGRLWLRLSFKILEMAAAEIRLER